MEEKLKIKVVLDEGGIMPTKAYSDDAGFDIYSPIDTYIAPMGSVVVDTKVRCLIPKGYCGLLTSKSGLYIKSDLTGRGLVDASYQGTIKVKLVNHGDKLHSFNKGDKLIQMMILPVPEVEMVEVEAFDEVTERAEAGIGSTGR